MRASLPSPLVFAGLCFSSVACSTSTESPDSPSGAMTADGDAPEVSGLADGQSGSEGTELRMPCFFQEQQVFTVEVTSTAGGCFAGEIVALHSEGAETSSFAVGDSIGGVMESFYTSSEFENGDVVAVQYIPPSEGDGAALSGSVQVSPLVGERVEIEWQGGVYQYTVDELLGDDCEETIHALPNLLEEEPGGEDPDDGRPAAPAVPTCPPE